MPHIKAFTAAPDPQVRTSEAFAKSCSSGIHGPVPGCLRILVQPGGVQFLGVPLGPIPRCIKPTTSPPSGLQGSSSIPRSSHRSSPLNRMLLALLWNLGHMESHRPPKKSLPHVAFSATRTRAPRFSAASAATSNRPYRFQISKTSHFDSVVRRRPIDSSPLSKACLR
jgi:hypothetical protein